MSGEDPGGYHIESIFAHQLVFQGVASTDDLADAFSFEYGWEWTPIDEKSFFVVLSMRSTPGKDRPERITVSMTGKFRREGNPERPAFVDFVMLNATTILSPYVRQAVSDLSGRGRKGAFTLPPFNVVRFMAQMKFETSGGAERLLLRPDIAASYGIGEDVMKRTHEHFDLIKEQEASRQIASA